MVRTQRDDPASWAAEPMPLELGAPRRPRSRQQHYDALAARLDDLFLAAMARHGSDHGERER